METLISWVVLLPLIAAICCGAGGRVLGRIPSAATAIAGVGGSCALSVLIAFEVIGNEVIYNFDWYIWAQISDLKISIGFLVDGLSAVMMVVVTSVSLMVHIFTMGYMRDDPGYQRFFAYIALFTFAMLMLVMSNNFMQLFLVGKRWGWCLICLSDFGSSGLRR